MTNKLEIFNFKEKMVRTTVLNGEIYFVVKDICNILDLQNVGEAIKKLDTDELTSEKLMSGGQNREMKLVNESGMYKLIFRSNKPEAKKFTKWVTSEVLPAIRKTGSYSINSKNSNVNYTSDKEQKHDPQFIKMIKELYGAKAARKYLAPILGIEYEEQAVILDVHEPDLEMQGFVDESIDFDTNSFLSSKVLYKTYIQWAERQGIVDILSNRAFAKAFNETTKLTSYQKRFNADRIRGYDLGLRI